MKWLPPAGRVLVLAPHADDETLGCGGALILHRRRGDPVHIVFVTDGRAGDPRKLSRAADLAVRRRREARSAARILGVRGLEFWDYPDGRLSGAKDLTTRLTALIRVKKPRVLYRPACDDPHPDHRALGRAVERALKRLKPRLIDCRYEVLAAPRPTAVLDVSRDFARKLQAFSAYRSQQPYLDSAEVAKLGVSRGLMIGARFGEGYRIRGFHAPRRIMSD